MAEFINTVDIVGDDALTDSIFARTITEYKSDTVLNIHHYVFRRCNQLIEVDCPRVITVGKNAFHMAENLVRVNLPNVMTIGASAFDGCKSLKNIEFPNLTAKLKERGFLDCIALESVSFPKLKGINSYAFGNSRALKFADIGVCGEIPYSLFSGHMLTSVVLRKADAIANLSNINAFDAINSAPEGTVCTIYVPQALITEYQNATNWSTLYASGKFNFVAIEGSEHE